MNVTNLTNFVVRTDTISAYLAAINKIPALTDPQEEKDLFAKYESTTDEQERIDIRNEIITRNLRFNFAVAKRYNTGDILPDLINVGTMAMFVAFEKYHWEKDVRFCTFAVWYIRRDIKAYLEKENLIVRPKNNARIAPKVKKIENEFFLKNGRKPYPIEVIDALRRDYGIEVQDELDIYGAKVDRLDAYIGDDKDFTVEDTQAFTERTSVENAYETDIEDGEISYQVKVLMNVLSDREKKVICLAFGYGCDREYKDNEIGQKIGLTSERVRQIRHEALKKMRAAHMANAE